VTPAEELELRDLADQAFDLRGTGYLIDACQAIIDWHERRPVRAYWREQEELWAARVHREAFEKQRARRAWAA
jgi:hypothetical protein